MSSLPGSPDFGAHSHGSAFAEISSLFLLLIPEKTVESAAFPAQCGSRLKELVGFATSAHRPGGLGVKSPRQDWFAAVYQSVFPSDTAGSKQLRLPSTWKFAAVPHTPCVCASVVQGSSQATSAMRLISRGRIHRADRLALQRE